MTKKKATSAPREVRQTARDRLLGAANDLFYRRGIRAVGVDQVVKAADAAKISLYRAFPSKDDLIVAYLKERDAMFWLGWDDALSTSDGAFDQLRAGLTFVQAAVDDPDYRGCPFVNFTSEFPDRDHEGRRVVEASKTKLRQALLSLCSRMTLDDPARLAGSLFLLIEGAFSVAMTRSAGDPPAGDALLWTAETLLSADKIGVASGG